MFSIEYSFYNPNPENKENKTIKINQEQDVNSQDFIENVLKRTDEYCLYG